MQDLKAELDSILRDHYSNIKYTSESDCNDHGASKWSVLSSSIEARNSEPPNKYDALRKELHRDSELTLFSDDDAEFEHETPVSSVPDSTEAAGSSLNNFATENLRLRNIIYEKSNDTVHEARSLLLEWTDLVFSSESMQSTIEADTDESLVRPLVKGSKTAEPNGVRGILQHALGLEMSETRFSGGKSVASPSAARCKAPSSSRAKTNATGTVLEARQAMVKERREALREQRRRDFEEKERLREQRRMQERVNADIEASHKRRLDQEKRATLQLASKLKKSIADDLQRQKEKLKLEAELELRRECEEREQARLAIQAAQLKKAEQEAQLQARNAVVERKWRLYQTQLKMVALRRWTEFCKLSKAQQESETRVRQMKQKIAWFSEWRMRVRQKALDRQRRERERLLKFDNELSAKADRVLAFNLKSKSLLTWLQKMRLSKETRRLSTIHQRRTERVKAFLSAATKVMQQREELDKNAILQMDIMEGRHGADQCGPEPGNAPSIPRNEPDSSNVQIVADNELSRGIKPPKFSRTAQDMRLIESMRKREEERQLRKQLALDRKREKERQILEQREREELLKRQREEEDRRSRIEAKRREVQEAHEKEMAKQREKERRTQINYMATLYSNKLILRVGLRLLRKNTEANRGASVRATQFRTDNLIARYTTLWRSRLLKRRTERAQKLAELCRRAIGRRVLAIWRQVTYRCDTKVFFFIVGAAPTKKKESNRKLTVTRFDCWLNFGFY